MEKLEAFSVFFSVFLTLAFVLFLAWFFLRWMGQRAPLQGGGSKHIKILDRVIIDRDKYLLIISAGDKVMLIAMNSGAVEMLCEFDEQQKAQFTASRETEQSFSSVLKQILPKAHNGFNKGGSR